MQTKLRRYTGILYTQWSNDALHNGGRIAATWEKYYKREQQTGPTCWPIVDDGTGNTFQQDPWEGINA